MCVHEQTHTKLTRKKKKRLFFPFDHGYKTFLVRTTKRKEKKICVEEEIRQIQALHVSVFYNNYFFFLNALTRFTSNGLCQR